MINYKQKDIIERVNKLNEYRRIKYNQPPEDTSTIYVIFRRVEGGQVPSTIYVGKTKQELKKRLQQHIQDMSKAVDGKLEWSLKTRWIYHVLKEGGEMAISPLSIVPNSKAYEMELEWITYLGISGFKMMNGDNSSYYNKIQ